MNMNSKSSQPEGNHKICLLFRNLDEATRRPTWDEKFNSLAAVKFRIFIFYQQNKIVIPIGGLKVAIEHDSIDIPFKMVEILNLPYSGR